MQALHISRSYVSRLEKRALEYLRAGGRRNDRNGAKRMQSTKK